MHNIIWMHIAQMHIMYVQDSVLNVPDIEIFYKMSKYDVMLPSSAVLMLLIHKEQDFLIYDIIR